MRTRFGAVLVVVAVASGLVGCQSRKEALQYACESPDKVDSKLPPKERGQAVADYIEKNVKNSEVLGLLGGAQAREVKAKKLDALAKEEGIQPCALAELWDQPPPPAMSAMPFRPPMPGSALPRMSAAPYGSAPPSEPQVEVMGALPIDAVKSVVEKNSKAIVECYKAGLKRDPKLQGAVLVRFVIGSDGKVSNVKELSNGMPDAKVTECIVGEFKKLTFPKPEKGEVVVTYPIALKLGT